MEVNKLRETHAGMQWATMGHMLSLSQSNDNGKSNQASRFAQSSELVLDALKAEKQARRKGADGGQWHYDNGMSTETSTKLRDLETETKGYIALARDYGGRMPSAGTSLSAAPGSPLSSDVNQAYSNMSSCSSSSYGPSSVSAGDNSSLSYAGSAATSSLSQASSTQLAEELARRRSLL